MDQHAITKQRIIQWVIIILALVGLTGGYYYYQSRAASTIRQSAPTFQADLQNSLILQQGTGNPTFTRATTATFTDWEGVVRPVLSGEARFQGARRVRNLFSATEAISIGANWAAAGSVTVTPGTTDPDGGNTAFTITANANNTGVYKGIIATSGRTFTESLWVKRISGSGSVKTGVSATAITSAVTTSWQRVSITEAGTGFNPYLILLGTSGDSVAVWHPQYEDVTGQSNQNPSEYVSVGVLSAPYHGAGVDGVKYFRTTNGNTVASNVVTEATGAAINSGTSGINSSVVDAVGPYGYLAEGARTNLAKQSEALDTTANWTASNVTVAANSTTAPDGATTADTLTASADNGTLVQAITGTAASYTFSIYLKRLTGTGAVSISADGTTFTTCTVSSSSWTRCTDTRTLTAASYNQTIKIATNTDAVYAWGAQSELGALSANFASSYIPTTSAAVTRNRDDLTYVANGNISDTTGTAYLEHAAPGIGGVSNPRLLTSVAVSQSPLTFISNSNMTIWDGTNFATQGLSALVPNTVEKYATTWSGSTGKTYKNGTAGSGSAYDGSFGFAGSSIYINGGSSTQNAVSTVRNVKIYDTALSDNQVKNIPSNLSTSASSSVTEAGEFVANRPDFEANLTNTIDLQKGVGSPTFTRADGANQRASVTDFESLIRKVKNGEARFEGARRVENLVPSSDNIVTSFNSSNLMTITSGISDPNGGTSAYRLTATGNTAYALRNASGAVVGESVRNSIWIRRITGSGDIALYSGDEGAATIITSNVTTSWQRIAAPVRLKTTSSNSYIGIILYVSGNEVDVWHPQIEKVSGQANQNPSEYVSCGTLSSPYHGTGADCVKYFETENVNTVASNIVTEPATIGATLEGHSFGSLPGTSGSYFSTPDSAANSITGDIDIRMKVAMTDWSPATTQRLVVKRGAGGTAYEFILRTDAKLSFYDGAVNLTSTAANTITDGTTKWIRATVDTDNGASAKAANYYTSDDGVTWTQLGTTVTGGTAGALTDTTDAVNIGIYYDGVTDPSTGKFYRALILSGIDGTAKVDFDPSQWSSGNTWTSRTSEVWTRNGGASLWKNSLKGYLAEGSRTNSALRSEEFDNAAYTSSGTPIVTANAAVAPDGTLTAETIQDDDSVTSFEARIHASITVANDSNSHVYSIYVKKTSGGTSATFGINSGVQGGTLVAVNSRLNTDTGAVSGGATVEDKGDYWRVWNKITNNSSGNTSLYLNIYPATGANGSFSDVGTATGTATVWGLQVELTSSFPSSYIPTTSATVTRAGDALSYLSTNNLSVLSDFTLYNEATSVSTAGGANRVSVRSNTAYTPYLMWDVTGVLRFYADTAGSTGYASATLADASKPTVQRVAARKSGSTVSLFVGGTKGTDGTAGTQPGADITTINVGSASTSSGHLYGTVKNVKIWKKVLSDTELTKLTGGQDSAIQKTTINKDQNDKQTSGLVGFWPFNGKDVSGTSAYDRSPVGTNHGTISGATKAIGKVGQALDFDGTDDYISLGDKDAFSFGNSTTDSPFSVSAWIKMDDATNFIIMTKYGASATNREWFFYVSSSDKIRFVTQDASASAFIGRTYNTALTSYEGQWIHVVGIYDGSESNGGFQIYLNGSRVDDTNDTNAVAYTAMENGAESLEIGRSPASTPVYANGSIDEVRIYNTALSAPDIANLYNLGR